MVELFINSINVKFYEILTKTDGDICKNWNFTRNPFLQNTASDWKTRETIYTVQGSSQFDPRFEGKWLWMDRKKNGRRDVWTKRRLYARPLWSIKKMYIPSQWSAGIRKTGNSMHIQKL